MKKFCKTGLNIILTLGLILSVGLLAWKQQPTEMGIVFLVWAFLFLFWNLDKFEYMKIGQVEAKARKLDKIVKEAEVTLEQLKEVAAPNMNYIFLFLADGMRYGQVEATEQEEIFRELYQLSQKLDLKNEEYIKRAFYGVLNKYCIEINYEFRAPENLRGELKNMKSVQYYFEEIEKYWTIDTEEQHMKATKKFNKMKGFVDDFNF